MTGEQGATSAPRAEGNSLFGLGERERDALLAWVGENLTMVRRSASGQRVLYWSLSFCFMVGLAAHVGGFLLKYSMKAEALLLVADLLYALGWALWTGVVVVLFVQIYPEAKKRQYKQALDAYEAAVGGQGHRVKSMDEVKQTLVAEMIENGWRAPDGRTDAHTDALGQAPAQQSAAEPSAG